VIDSDGSQRGVMKTRDAVRAAEDQGLDLVEVAPNENPPVCRIMDFGRYQYEEKKKKRESRKKQSRVEVKECKFRPKIGDHDFDVRIRRAVKFLGQGNKVKLTVMFRGREHAHPEVAERLILRAFDQLKDLGKLEAPPKKEGRDMHALVAPLPEATRKKAMKERKESGKTPKERTREEEEARMKEEEEKESKYRVVREGAESEEPDLSKDEGNEDEDIEEYEGDGDEEEEDEDFDDEEEDDDEEDDYEDEEEDYDEEEEDEDMDDEDEFR
jgi:translation initiation factor IF-3